MKIFYTLEKEDFLAFQLYTASKSEQVSKKRKRNKIIIPVIYTLLGLVLFFTESKILALLFFVLAILWFILYPRYESKRYIKHFDKFIEENYKNIFNKQASIQFEDNHVYMNDHIGEARMDLSALEALNETSDHYFLKFNSGVSLIIPKKSIEAADAVKQFLSELTKKLNINHNIDLDWVW